MTGPHFGMIPRWLAPLDLTGREFRVLLVIASHAGKTSREPRPDGVIETRIARLGTERIADEANLDRRNVQRAIRQLEAKGILERLHGGGRGRSSEYQVIFKQAADATNSVDDDAVSDADDTGNSVVLGQETASFSDLNSVTDNAVSDAGDTGNSVVLGQETASFSDLNSVTDDAPAESKQKERTDPPSGESHAHAREEGGSSQNDSVDERHPSLLLPINGGGERLTAFRRYNPSAATIEFAEALGVNALADAVLGKFIDHYLGTVGRPPNGDFDAAFRNWIRKEPTFAARRGPPRSPQCSDPIEALWRRAFEAREEEDRAYRAEGGEG
jgi:DNA-binding MarR family transcriptional regulator